MNRTWSLKFLLAALVAAAGTAVMAVEETVASGASEQFAIDTESYADASATIALDAVSDAVKVAYSARAWDASVAMGSCSLYDNGVLVASFGGEGEYTWSPSYGMHELSLSVEGGETLQRRFFKDYPAEFVVASSSSPISMDTRAGEGTLEAKDSELIHYSSFWTADANATATVTLNGVPFAGGKGEDVAEWVPTVAGTYTFQHTTAGSDETLTATFDVVAKDISLAQVAVDCGDVTYSGSVYTPVIQSATFDGRPLVEGTDYTLAYSGNVNAGIATITLSGINLFNGTYTTNFTIRPKSLTSAMVGNVANVTYTGSAHMPEPTVTDSPRGVTLAMGTDYTLSWGANTLAGSGSVTVTGKGNYTGSVTKNFTIAKATYDMSGAAWDYAGEFAYDGTAKSVHVSGLPSNVTADYTGNTATAPGTYTAHAELTYDTANFNKPEIADLVWVIKSAEETKLKEIFDGLPATIEPDGEGGWKVTITNDIDSVDLPIEIPDNIGHVTIDLNGHDLIGWDGVDGGCGATALPGGDGKPTIRIVPGDGEGEPTVITIVNSGGDATVQGGEGGAGNPGGNGAPAIEVADWTQDGVLINVGEDVTVQGGNGGASDTGRGGNGGAGIVGNVGTNDGTIVGGNGGASDTGDGGNGGAGVDGNVDVNNGGISGGAGGGSEGGTDGDSGAGVTGDVGTDNGVVLPYALTEEMVGEIEPQPFTGEEMTPEILVFDAARNRTLEEGTDYVLRWADNIRPGTASVTVTGKGSYLGEVTRTFAIGTPVEHTLTVGEYFYATLAELGYDVPTNGTPYSVVAKGLPAGLKLKYNPAWKNKKGKVVIKAKSEWWIEGVPTAAMDFFENPPYLVITANGKTWTEPLPIEVLAQDVVVLEDLALGQSVNEQFYLLGVTNGWTVSGLPTGLKYTAKRLTEKWKSGKQTMTVTKALPYSVYGKTTKAGLFTITAKKKVGAYYETMKYRVLVRPREVNAAVFGETLTNITTMAYVPVAWDLVAGGLAGGLALPGEDGGHAGRVTLPVVSNVVKVAGLPSGVTFAAKDTYGYANAKKKTGKYLKQAGQTIVGTPTKPGTYVVTFTKNVKSGKKTIAKTAQMLWVVEPNDAKVELGFNDKGGVVESGVVGLNYGDLLAFSATSNATVTASGLPAGMKLVRVDEGGSRPVATGSGTDATERVPPAWWAFTGYTAKAGTYLVTVKATLNGKTVTQRLALKVEGLPTWAKGTYNGIVMGMGNGEWGTGNGEQGTCETNGLATVTVSAVGKISGKFYEGGTNWTLTAASYTGYDTDASNCTATVTAKYSWKVKSGKKTVTKSVSRTFTLSVAPGEFGGVATLTETGESQSSATEITAWQNLWGSTYKAVGKALFTSKSGKKTLANKTFTIKGSTDVGTEIGLREADTLTLKVTSAGAVTATLSYDTGKTKKDPKTKKTEKVTYKATCQSVVVPQAAADEEPFAGEVPLYFAPSAANGFSGFAGWVAVP